MAKAPVNSPFMTAASIESPPGSDLRLVAGGGQKRTGQQMPRFQRQQIDFAVADGEVRAQPESVSSDHATSKTTGYLTGVKAIPYLLHLARAVI